MAESTFSEAFASNTRETRTQSTVRSRRASQARTLVRGRRTALAGARTAGDERYVRPDEATTQTGPDWESEGTGNTYDFRRAWFRFCQAVAQEFPRIQVDLHLMAGRPSIRGTTITVAQIQDL